MKHERQSIQAQSLKHGSPEFIQLRHKLLDFMWKGEKYVTKIGTICPLLKKGKPMQCVNYRGTKLPNATCKVSSTIIYARLFCYAGNAICKYRSGYHSGKITVDQIFT
jgi:hypothetical protein